METESLFSLVFKMGVAENLGDYYLPKNNFLTSIHNWIIYFNKDSIFIISISAVDRHRCIIQPDKPQFTSGIALLTTLVMVVASILLSLPMYQSAEVSPKLSYPKSRGKSLIESWGTTFLPNWQLPLIFFWFAQKPKPKPKLYYISSYSYRSF